jgi:type IV pilus assembly protein PilW
MKTLRENPVAVPALFQGGFTIIELLVSAVIGLLVLLAVSYAFVGGRHTYVLNSEMMRMQENARAVQETLRRDIRMATFRGCADIEEMDDASSSLSAADFGHFKNGLHVTDAYAGTIAATDMADGKNSTGLEIHGVGANAGEAGLRSELIVGSSPAYIMGGKLAEQLAQHTGTVLLSDCEKGVFLDSSGGTMSGQTGSIAVAGDGGGAGTVFTRGAQVFQYTQPRAFRLKTGVETFAGMTPNASSLYYNIGKLTVTAEDELEELASGVEAFRLCAVDEKGEKTYLDPAATAATEGLLKKAMQIQVDMVLVSRRPEVLPEAALYEMRLCGESTPDTVSYSRTDRRLRRLFSAAVMERNKLMDVPVNKK